LRRKFWAFILLQSIFIWTSLYAQTEECAVNTFQKTYGISNDMKLALDIVETPDHGYISGGWGASAFDQAFLMKVDKKGAIVWTRQIGSKNTIYGFVKKIIRLSDGNYLALCRGYPAAYIDTWVIKFDENGNTIWIKEIPNPTGVGDDGYDICETADHGFAIAASYAPYANAGGSLVMKFDANGNYLWGKGDLNTNAIVSILEKNGILYVAGVNYPSGSGIIMKILSTNGSVIGARIIRVDDKYTRFTGVAEMNNKIYIDASNTDNQSFDNLHQVVLIADTDLNVLKVHKFNVQGATDTWEIQSMFPTSDGGFIACTCFDYGEVDVLLFKVSYDGTIQWKRKYPRPGEQRPWNMRPTSDNGIIGVGTSNDAGGFYDYNNIFIFKTDSLGLTPDCPVEDPIAVITNPVFTSYPVGISYNPLTFPVVPVVCPNVSISIPTNTFCEKISLPACNQIKVTGSDSICNLSDTMVYRAVRNSNCTAAVTWSVDNSFAKVVSSTDTALKIYFIKRGTTKIFASISNPCENITDSLTVNILISPDRVDLGQDVAICQNSSYTLHAGAGFKSYQWQDGSSDSLLTVRSAGRYYVTVTNYCGEPISDTINISLAPPEFFDIGNDTSKCNNETLILSATPGFNSYTWSPNYNISNTGGQSVKVSPDMNTTYHVTAVKNSGCIVSDSIKVTVYHSAPIYLGNDTSFCNGGAITLDPGTGFTSYLWNTGETSRQISVSSAGKYIIAAKDNHQCVSKDTLSIISVYPNPVVALQKDSVLCEGVGLILDAGAGYKNYLWQDNSVNQTLQVITTGKYWVAITDNNSCKGSDTTEIKRIGTVPANFLIKDTTICNGQPTLLTPLSSFKNYLWSNSEITKQITITSTGTYWLQVTNNDGCNAKEYIDVKSKEGCIQAVYFPNAFTPNGDGLNDVFKATVFGTLKNFYLVIYNRFGQKVFETHHLSTGWNGRVHDAASDSGSFVWYSEYQFDNQPSKTIKGAVTLIR
jgi:gliding motility-associated-like protein